MSAISALKGYRTQFLYSLYRILKDYNKNYIFKVEGNYEDLDILNESNDYIESIQIKNKGATLSFSDMFSSKDSFFKRSIRLININPKAKIKIVSFGNISNDLTDKIRLKKKLLKKGFTQQKVEKILNNYSEPEIVSEIELKDKIFKYLKSICIFSNPNIGLELLLFWIYKAGENQTPITTINLIDDLDRIGKYISEQNAIYNQFGNTIIPFKTKSLNELDLEDLQKGFYYGVSVKYEHILANFDVKREEKLNLISKAFEKKSIVFIHGASGQGKSTLAYRYLNDFSDNYATYELKLSNNLNDTFELINSLDSLCKGLKFPITLYIDISPQNSNWSNILKELNSKKNLKFLITIRQEDWNRTSLGEDFDFEDIELNFNKNEAKIIYDSLSQYKLDLKFTDFEESWLQFGNKGMLLEYVYFINQGDKLKNRLQNQIGRLEKEKKVEELEILRFVCLSDAFNSKIDYLKLIDFLKINKGLSNSFVKLLEKEYLLKFADDKRYLTGLHPIRSKLLCEILFFENDYLQINDYIDYSVPIVNEKDLHKFLLNSFDVGYDVDSLLQSLFKTKIKHPNGFINIFNALLWKGTYDYTIKDNYNIFDEAYKHFKSAWWIFIVIDFSDMRTDDSILDLFETIHKNDANAKEKRKLIEKLTSQLSDKKEVFKYCNRWLNKLIDIPFELKDDTDYKSTGEFLFWLGYLKKKNIKININIESISNFFVNTKNELESKAVFLLGLKSFDYFKEKEDEKTHLELSFLKHFRTEYLVPFFRDDGINFELKYFFDITDETTNNKKSNHKSFAPELDDSNDLTLPSESPNMFHDRTMTIVELLRKAFPDRNKFKINGVGYNAIGTDTGYDPTSKDIPIKNLPISFITRLNGLIIHLFDYTKRPNTWNEYIEETVSIRKQHLSALIEFRNGLSKYFKNQIKGIKFLEDNENIIKEKVYDVDYQMLPSLIADKWCYHGDSTRLEVNNTQIAYSLAKYKNFIKLRRDYFTSVRNFINHGFNETANTVKRLLGKEDEIENDNLRNLSEVVLFDSFIHLIDFQKEFDDKFSKYVNSKEINNIYNKETNITLSLISIWKAFIYSKYRHQPSIIKSASLQFEKTKSDFQMRIIKELQEVFLGTDYYNTLITDNENKNIYIFLNIDFETFSDALGKCFEAIVNIFSDMHYTSLKRLICKLNFENILIIPLIKGNALNDKFYQLSISQIDSIKEKLFSGYTFTNYFELFSFPDDYNVEIFEKEKVRFWNKIIVELKLIEDIIGLLSSVKYLNIFVKQLIENFNDIDELGTIILKSYYEKFSIFVDEKIVKKSIENLTKLTELSSSNIIVSKALQSLQTKIISLDKYNSTQAIMKNGFENYIINIKDLEFLYEDYSKTMILCYDE
ncbi:P-loop NTPase [Tenacibaculum xiamenense]|uniref:P-loop NTPase n=1 Tax=Tenacibaculum xiamenense TaxID=1261553 RepID=UPI003895D864